LLIPTTIAALWTLVGRETIAIPPLIAGLFTLASIGIVTSSLSVLRTRSQGLLAGLIVACTPYFITHGANQYTDIPIGFFFLATFVFLHLYDRFEESGNGFLILAGITTGLSAWTKNEGLLFMVAVVVARFAVALRQRELKTCLKHIRFFAIGLLPIL